jgi:hypothetical protein
MNVALWPGMPVFRDPPVSPEWARFRTIAPHKGLAIVDPKLSWADGTGLRRRLGRRGGGMRSGHNLSVWQLAR